MASRKILVVCHSKPNNEILDTSIQTIEKYVTSLFPGDRTQIEYMNKFGEVDYHFELSRNPDAIEFVNDHVGQYDAILLNNCILGEISYGLIHDLLKPNGLMIVKAIKRIDEWPVSLNDEQFDRPVENFYEHTHERVREVLDTYFTYDKYKRIFYKKQVVPLSMLDTLRNKIRNNRRSYTPYKRWGGKRTRKRTIKKK
jgi:hypothetical protein